MRWVLLFCLCCLVAASQAQRGGQYPKGSSLVKIFLKTGGQYTGILMDAVETGMVVASPGNPEVVERFSPELIQRIEIRKVNSVKRNAMIGAGIGFLAGFVIGWQETGSGVDMNQIGHAAGAGLLGAFAGGFIGFISGTATKKYEVLGSVSRYNIILPKLSNYKPPAPDED